MRPIDGLASAPKPKSTTFKPRRSLGRLIFGFLAGMTLVILGVLTIALSPILAALPSADPATAFALIHLARPGVYLVIFQNNRELRPTGGFIGSFAEIETGWGGLPRKVTVETNIYTRDAQYRDQLRLAAPEPLAEFLRGEIPWSLRDSNWALDFPEAAETMAWFYQQEGGRPVDGVMAVDTRLLERLLTLTGPITLPESGQTVNAQTVVGELQTEIEKNYWQDPASRLSNQPKGVIADLLPVLLKHLKQIKPAELARSLAAAGQAKELLVSVRDRSLARSLRQANWDGHVADSAGDYLYLNEANLTAVDPIKRSVGAKSSASIERSVRLVRENSQQQLIIGRQHRGQMVWPDGPNDSYLRVAVPQGTSLLSITKNGRDLAGETRLGLESDKTTIGFWSRLNPGESDEIVIRYQLPVDLTDSSLLIQRQPGVAAYPLEIWDETTLRWAGLLDRDVQL